MPHSCTAFELFLGVILGRWYPMMIQFCRDMQNKQNTDSAFLQLPESRFTFLMSRNSFTPQMTWTRLSDAVGMHESQERHLKGEKKKKHDKLTCDLKEIQQSDQRIDQSQRQNQIQVVEAIAHVE